MNEKQNTGNAEMLLIHFLSTFICKS